MEVESVTTTETEGAAEAIESEAGLVSTGADPGLSQEPAAASDASVTVSSDSATAVTVDDGVAAVEAVSPSSLGDATTAESPARDDGPSTEATGDCGGLQQGWSVDPQWSSSVGAADTVQGVQPHPTTSLVLLEDDHRTATTAPEEQRIDNEPDTAAEVSVQPPPSSFNAQQQQQPEHLAKEEHVQVEDFKAG